MGSDLSDLGLLVIQIDGIHMDEDMMQSILVLLYVCGHFGYDIAETFGAITLLALFASIEAFLFRVTRSSAP